MFINKITGSKKVAAVKKLNFRKKLVKYLLLRCSTDMDPKFSLGSIVKRKPLYYSI